MNKIQKTWVSLGLISMLALTGCSGSEGKGEPKEGSDASQEQIDEINELIEDSNNTELTSEELNSKAKTLATNWLDDPEAWAEAAPEGAFLPSEDASARKITAEQLREDEALRNVYLTETQADIEATVKNIRQAPEGDLEAMIVNRYPGFVTITIMLDDTNAPFVVSQTEGMPGAYITRVN